MIETAIPIAEFSVFPDGALSLGTELFSSIEGDVQLLVLLSPVEDESSGDEVVLLSDDSLLLMEKLFPLSVRSQLSVVGSLLSLEVLISVLGAFYPG